MNTYIYMVRHAESPFIFGEERTRKLSSQGESDAERVANLLMDQDIDVIVSSPYTRAVQTVQELANRRGLPIHEYEQLRERPIKGLEFEISEDEILEGVRRSFENIDFCLERGETIRQAQNRAIPLIKKLLKEYEGKNIVIGTHGNIMTAIMNDFNDRYGYDFWKSTSKPDIYRLEFNKGTLIEVNRVWN